MGFDIPFTIYVQYINERQFGRFKVNLKVNTLPVKTNHLPSYERTKWDLVQNGPNGTKCDTLHSQFYL